MKNIRFKHVFLLIFAFLFINLLSINVTRINAEEEVEVDLSNAYRGEINDYWAVVNYGKDYTGQDTITIFMDPEAISNPDVTYIQINELDQYGDIRTMFFKRGIDSSFASRFTYTFVNKNYGLKNITIFLLADLKNTPTSIVERINISRLEKVRTIENLGSNDFKVYQEVTETTVAPYKVYVEIKENPQDYKIKEVRYWYLHKNADGSEEIVYGSAISETGDYRFYFTVSENSTYYIEVEDYFGFIKGNDESDRIKIDITNFEDSTINIIASYDTSLTSREVPVTVTIYNGRGDLYDLSAIKIIGVSGPNGFYNDNLKNLGVFTAQVNGVYYIWCELNSGEIASIEINITNIDTDYPLLYVSNNIQINSSDVVSPYVFDPYAHVIATDNATFGDKLYIHKNSPLDNGPGIYITYYYVPAADPTCKIRDFLEVELTVDAFDYLHAVNDVCIEYVVTDEAGNPSSISTKITVFDNTIPTITSSVKEIILQIGDDIPTNEELIDRFGLEYNDNSLKYNPERPMVVDSDLSGLNLEELGVYDIFITVTDGAGNVSDPLKLSVTVTVRVLVVKAVPKQHIIYGEPMIEILYTCNDNPCINHADAEILPADWNKLVGELYITSGAKYVGDYPIQSSLAINSEKYKIQLTDLGYFYILKRVFKVVANSYTIDYKDEEPTLTWYMDTSVCEPGSGEMYLDSRTGIAYRYSCTFVEGDGFGGGSYVYDESSDPLLYAGAIKREEGITVKYNASNPKQIDYYKIHLGDLSVAEASSGGKVNYFIDFFGLYEGELYRGNARFYIIPKYVEVTIHNINKVYGETDPLTLYDDEKTDVKREDGRTNYQYEFTCFAYKYPINEMTRSECQQEIELIISRVNGETVGSYEIKGFYLNVNYDVRFNEEFESAPVDKAYLTVLQRDITIRVVGENNDGKYTIFYEDALPEVTIEISNDPNLRYEGLAKNNYANINDGSIISFDDYLDNGEHPYKYLDSNGNVMKVVIGGFEEYITGVGIFTITRDTITIFDKDGNVAIDNYNLTFVDGSLEVLARQIYIKIVEGLEKTYGDSDPSFDDAYIERKYGDKAQYYVIDGNKHFVLQIINTLDNTDIVNREDYIPFDKDKLQYYLVRTNLRFGAAGIDVHDGEMVGKYLVNKDKYVNDTNYIIDIYEDYYFSITKRTAKIVINDATIEFNYANKVPKFSYSYSNTVFGDAFVGQPSVRGFVGNYRNNGNYPIVMGNITALSSKPIITSVDNVWYINGEETSITLDDFSDIDVTLLTLVSNKYHIVDVENQTTVDTGVSLKETNVMWNYDFDVTEGNLEVIPRHVVIVPDDGKFKQYGDYDKVGELTFKVKHWSNGEINDELEAILDPSDFENYLSRESGEEVGTYLITQGNLTPSLKGNGLNFMIMGFESNHTFEIVKRKLVVKHVRALNGEIIELYYGDDIQGELSSTGYVIVEGSLANTQGNPKPLTTMEIINGQLQDSIISDTVVGEVSVPPNASNVGQYQVTKGTLRVIRQDNKQGEIDVTKYYDLQFVEVTLIIHPKVIRVTPIAGQNKIYGEDDHTGTIDGCGIGFTYAPLLIKPSDIFVGCLEKKAINTPNGEVTEDVGSYEIIRGSLNILSNGVDSGNYEIIVTEGVMFQILPRPIVVTGIVEGDTVRKIDNNKYAVTYQPGNDYFGVGFTIAGMGLANNPALGIEDFTINNFKLDPEYDGVRQNADGEIIPYEVVRGDFNINKIRNYTITWVHAQLTVEKHIVRILPNSVSKLYGQIDDPTLTYSIIGAEEDLIPAGGLSRVPGEDAGKYLITAGNLYFGDDYIIVMVEDVYFEIIPRNVIIKAHNVSKLFGVEADPKFEFDTIYPPEHWSDGFVIDVEIVPGLYREDTSNDVGEYEIKINRENLLMYNNYNISYEGAKLTINYADITELNIRLLSGDQYQLQGENIPVSVFAEFNTGANPIYLNDVSWSITKTGGFNVKFDRDVNNVISFTPGVEYSGPGRYTIRATYGEFSDEFDVIVSTVNVSDIHIGLLSGKTTQVWGLESELSYYATIHLYEELDEELIISWYVGEHNVCNYDVKETDNTCTFIPDFGIGKYEVYAKIANVVSNKFEIIINDNAAPVIKLNNQDEIFYIEAHQNGTENSRPYVDPGFTATDDVLGDISDKVVIRGLEELIATQYKIVGTYYIVYEVTDGIYGHVANNFRTVIVQDTVAPEVSLNNPELKEIYLEYGDPYTEYNATAIDKYDISFGKEVVVHIDSNLNLNKIGVYEIIYFAIDSNGNRGQVTRTVHVEDNIKPTITLIGGNMVLDYKEPFNDPGAWFEDNYDGKFRIYPSKIEFKKEYETEIVEVASVDTSVLGTYYLTYYQEDSSHNPPENVAYRTVEVGDYTAPVITLLGSNPYILRYGTKYIEPGYKVIDNYDGDITNNTDLVTVIEMIGDTLGTYYVYYRAKDTHDRVAQEVKREVIILDLVSPIIYFTDACPQHIYIEAIVEQYNSDCNLPGVGYTVFDDYVPDIDAIQNWVEITGRVDNTLVGVYEIKYNVSDRSGNEAITLTRYVHVEDTLAPTIELLPNEEGAIDFYVEVFTEFVEPGWKVTDIYDSYHYFEIAVEAVNNININRLNTYTVTYVATDSNGNKSEPVYRYITVRDTVPPEVTLIGDEVIILERGTKYAEYGATAVDNYDGKLTVRDKDITGAPTGMQLGEYEVKYCVVDSSLNEGCAVRKVIVQDTIAPEVLGVNDGFYYRRPLYIYFSPLTGTDEVLTATLNGELITNPWYVYKEDTYNLVVKDDAGNVTEIDFVIDMTPPVLYGAKDGAYINHPVTVYSDELLNKIVYRLNNGGYIEVSEQELLLEIEGQYSVYAVDMAGNISNVISFVVDTTPPAYTLSGVLNEGITTNDVYLSTEANVTVSVNNKYIPTNYSFTENGYYKVVIRDLAGNDVLLQFVINKDPTVTISGKSVTFISQNNAIDKFIAKADSKYPKSSGFIYAKPLIEGGFEYISGKLFSDEEYSKLINGEDVSFDVPSVGEDEMVVAFIVTLDELNKFATQTVEGDEDSPIVYAFALAGVVALIAGFFYFFVIVKRNKEEEEEETEEIIDDNDMYY